jgi:cobalt-zinc-cadmium efflux system outer membrane protein
MVFHLRVGRSLNIILAFSLSVAGYGYLAPAVARSLSSVDADASGESLARSVNTTRPPGTPDSSESHVVSPTITLYFDPAQGASSEEIVRRALLSNGELMAALLDIVRARGKLRQAGLRPNPTIDFEQTTGRFTGAAGEHETSIGLSLLLELGGKRRRRIELAQAELEASEAEVANRERQLAGEVYSQYAEALAGLRALVEGRMRASLLRLKSLTGMPANEPLRLREDITKPPPLLAPPASLEAAVEVALRTRPDLRLARLMEEVSQAGLRLARAEAAPDVTASTKYSVGRSVFDDTPVGVLTDRDKLLTFGVSVGLPVFNKNQGAKAEAATAITQARTRREFLEAVVRSEVGSAYTRYEAARGSSNARMTISGVFAPPTS